MQGSVEAARFITLVLRMQKYLNIKSPATCCVLFVEDRKPLTNTSVRRLVCLKML